MGDTNSFSFYNSVLRTKTHQRVSESEQKDRSDDKIYTPPAKVIVAHQDVTEYIDGWGWELCLTSHFIASPPKQTGPKRKKFGEYSILTKRKLGSDGRTVIGVDLEIQSRSLREKLKELITIDYGIDLSADPIVIPKPYHMLFFERQMIFSYAEKQEKVAADLEDELGKKTQLQNRTEESVAEDEANLEDQRHLAQEFNLLANFIANDEDLIHTRNEFSQLEPQGMITFPLLWTIFRPGQLVRVDLDNKLECMRLQSIRLVIEEGLPLYRIVGLVTEFDGSTVGESKKIVEMYPFTSTKSISKLPVVPRKHWLNFESEKLQLVGRGKKWYNLSKGPQHLQYDDILFSRHPEPKLFYIQERVIIDPIAYYEEYVSDRPVLDKNAEDAQQFQYIPLVSGQYYEEEETEEAQLDDPSDSDITVIRRKPATKKRNITETVLRAPVLTDDHYMRFPAVIPGFALKSKRWGYFQVGDAFLKPIEWNKTAFMTLQMEGYKRDLIKSLLDGHKGTSSGFDDVVSGKGQGLIFLLYGPPGLGKTLTAETISEHTQRPLYVVSSGELTTNVDQMEHELSRIFKTGHRWEAIVLLDEADVLMSKRSSEALEGNAIVSVFLRCMEYYRGILFLTTNRVTDFDDAIMSRIHLLLQFDALTVKMRTGIWKSLIQTNSKTVTLERTAWTDEVYGLLGEFDVNGRMIKNFLQTAALSAKAQNAPLAPKHLLPIMMINLNSTHPGNNDVLEQLKKLGKFLGVEGFSLS